LIHETNMEVAITEPYFYAIHGGSESIPHHMVVYSYDVNEFYENTWQDEYKVAYRNIRRVAHQVEHDVIRNYKYHLNKHVALQLVKIYTDENNRELCVLHTYKLNVFKRLWRKRMQNRHRQL
jgi:hypothetical protein